MDLKEFHSCWLTQVDILLQISQTLVEKERGIIVINYDTWESIHEFFVLY